MPKLRIASAALALSALAAACAPEPAYAPPTDEEAAAAVARAVRADLIDAPPRRTVSGPTAIEPGDTPSSAGRKAGGVLGQEAERSDRLAAASRIASLRWVRVSDCRWGRVDAGAVRPYGRDRAEGVGRGWRCAYEEAHDTPTRGLVSAKGQGYFFHREDAYDFGGIEAGSYERVSDR